MTTGLSIVLHKYKHMMRSPMIHLFLHFADVMMAHLGDASGLAKGLITSMLWPETPLKLLDIYLSIHYSVATPSTTMTNLILTNEDNE